MPYNWFCASSNVQLADDDRVFDGRAWCPACGRMTEVYGDGFERRWRDHSISIEDTPELREKAAALLAAAPQGVKDALDALHRETAA